MAAASLQNLQKIQKKHAHLFEALGYGTNPQPVSQVTSWLLTAAVGFYFGLLPILWQETSIPSMVWTGAAAGLLWLASIAARHNSISIRNVTTCAVLFCLLYPVFGAISYLVWGQSSNEREALLLQTVPIMMLGLALYLTGAATRCNRIYGALWASWVIIICYIALNFRNLDPRSMYEATLETGTRLNYQQMGDAFAICCVILAPRIRQFFWQWLFIGISIGVMFIIPSRSAAFFGSVALLSIPVLFGGMFTRVMLIGLGLFALFGYESGMFAQWFEGSRFESALTPDAEDGSWSMRQEIMDHGMALLISKPFTGEWGFQLGDLKFAGYYIHNALDVWAQAGLLPFLLFMGIWVYMSIALLNGLSRWPRLAKEVIPVLIFAALSWSLSRNIGFVALFFCMGFASATLAQARYGNHGMR
ncbi:MAG: hypothetical protein Q4A16_07670 [Lautropia sp.]|nr:hypothetical protein [Lautropia sp.]